MEYIRIVNEGDYKVFVIENVPAVLTACGGEYLRAVIECLPEYRVKTNVMIDNEFGGHTIRKRAFIVGSRLGDFKFPKPTYNGQTVGDALSYVDESWHNYNDKVRSSYQVEFKMSFVPPGENFKAIPEDIRGKGVHSNSYKRLEMDKPSITLANFRKCVILHPVYNRIISVAEALAIQGFRKPFSVRGSMSQRVQQVGNGVPFNLGYAIKEMVKNMFLKGDFDLCQE